MDQGPQDGDLPRKIAEVLADQSGSVTHIRDNTVLGNKRGTARPLFNVDGESLGALNDNQPRRLSWDSEFDIGGTAKMSKPEDDDDGYTDIAPIPPSSYTETNDDTSPDECFEFDNSYTHIGPTPPSEYTKIDN